MNRLSFIAAHPKKTLLSLAALLVAGAIAVGSGANFTSTTTNPGNSFTAGNLHQTNSKDATFIITATKMKPGDPASVGTLTIANDGDIPGTFTLTKNNVVDTPGTNGGVLSTKLNLKVEDTTVPATPVTVYDGVIGSMPAQALGTVAAGVTKAYKFSVTFPDGGTPGSNTSGDNAYRASSMSIGYTWTEVQ
jgi:hypothetical protein